MQSRTGWILGGVGAVTLSLAALFWWQQTRALDVEIAEVREGPFEELLVEDGRTRTRWHVDFTAPVAGAWRPESLKVGDTVAAGAILGRLTAAPQDPATAAQLRARLGVAEAARAEARAALAAASMREGEARRALERLERLSPSGGVSEEQLDIARATHEGAARAREAASARLVAAGYEVEAARSLLPGAATRPADIRAPAAAVVLRVDEEHERIVAAGTPLLQVGAVGHPEIVARVLSADAPKVQLGAALYAIVGADTLRGHVTRIEPAAQTVRSALGVDEQRVPVIGDVHSAALPVGHDYQVDVRIVLRRIERATIVPTGALVRDGAAWRVVVVAADGAARGRTVDLVARGPEVSAVTGVAAGDRVVVYPPEGLVEGLRVR